MLVKIFDEIHALAAAASEQAAGAIRRALAARGQARIILATGASQFAFLEALTNVPGLDWPKVEAFHLDEYVGMPATHRASFRKILLERVVQKTGITKFRAIEADAADLPAAISEISAQLTSAPIDVAFIGIGENGHIAFNDPPADFETEAPYKIVELDEACRRQQVGEGWFADIAEVPARAVSMTPKQILKSRQIIAVVPDSRKAQAVKATVESKISAIIPASILKRHPDVTLYLDQHSAALLAPQLRKQSQFVVHSELS
ncbi:MAG TPA: glucosamine-6-phosphate deaminase [Candidatus Sulfotelmatobacter sp.]|nr:glucosamine-6-phosphate deaminase [Candidatus Sulfotelmatobacter sp.]